MNILTMSFWILINLIILDLFLGLLQRNTRVTNYAKTAGLFALLMLSLTRRHAFLVNRPATLRRFFLAVSVVCALALSCALLAKTTEAVLSTSTLRLALCPLVAMPFYHLIYGLMGHNLLAVNASLHYFRMRSMVNLVIGANLVMISIAYEAHLLVQSIHLGLALFALGHMFFFSSLPRSKPGNYKLEQEEYDVVQTAFMNYLVAILEFFYYALLLYFIITPITANFLNMPLFLGLFYISILALAKVLFVSRAVIGPDFYEDRILPLSFIIFGMNYIYQIYF